MGGIGSGRKYKFSESEHLQILHLLRTGFKPKQVAARMNCNVKSIYSYSTSPRRSTMTYRTSRYPLRLSEK
jgi:hypothetical protein